MIERTAQNPHNQTEIESPFVEMLKTQIKNHDRLILYYRKLRSGRFVILASKKPKMLLAEAAPWHKISAAWMLKEKNATSVNIPAIPVPSRRPSPEMVAKEIFSYFIPRFFPFASGKPIDLYEVNQKKSQGKPDIRIGFRGNLVAISHPRRKFPDTPLPKSSHPKTGTQAA